MGSRGVLQLLVAIFLQEILVYLCECVLDGGGSEEKHSRSVPQKAYCFIMTLFR